MATAPQPVPSDKTSLSSIRERWIKGVGPLEKQNDDDALHIGSSINAFGDLPVDRITKPLLTEFIDLLQRCPRNVPHALRRASLKDRIGLGREAGQPPSAEGLARRTVNAKGLGSISAALTMAEKLGHIAGNLCAGMGLTIAEADAVKREPNSPRDLRRLFVTSVCVGTIDIPVSGCGAAAHWSPLIAVFSGARLEELGQPLVGDFKVIDGVWCIHITALPDDEEDRKAWWGEDNPKAVKTAAARRYVPVHAELGRCGFLDLVAQHRMDGFRRLFPELKAYRGRRTKEWSKFWARHTDEHVTDSPSKTFHSFRHLFVAMLRGAGVDRDVIKAIVGHANKDVTASYGRIDDALFPIAVLNEALQKVRVEGLDLSHLHRRGLTEAAWEDGNAEVFPCLMPARYRREGRDTEAWSPDRLTSAIARPDPIPFGLSTAIDPLRSFGPPRQEPAAVRQRLPLAQRRTSDIDA